MYNFEAQLAAVEAANSEPVAKPDNKAVAAVINDASLGAEPAAEPLGLTDGDEAVDVPDGEEGGEEHEADDGKRRRSKPASQRIAELTAKLRQAERERDEARAPQQEEPKAPVEPDPADFEFGEADPKYQDARQDWRLEVREQERAKAESARNAQQAVVDKLNGGVAKAEAEAKAKYEDFDAKIEAAVEARGGEPLPPLLTVGISVSPVGGDILYRLATDEAASERLEKLARGGEPTSRAMAMAMGELEGEYLADDADDDLNLSDNLDMARLVGRMKARMKGAGKRQEAEPPVIVPTNAPEPPAQRARGGAGRGRAAADTDDTKAFYRDFGKELGV